MQIVMPDPRVDTKARFAKVHSKALAEECRRLGWTLRSEFRALGDEQSYEYLFEWLRQGQPVYPNPGAKDAKA